MSIKTTEFKKDTIIHFKGDEIIPNEFYIIQIGKVKQLTLGPEITEKGKCIFKENETILSPGDFMGIIPCMAEVPITHTLIAMEDVSALVVKREEFSDFTQNHLEIGIKLIRYFCNEVRKYNEMLPDIGSMEESLENLYKLGEYFSSHGSYNASIFAFSSYIKHCPNGPLIHQAQTLIEDAKMELEKFSVPLTLQPKVSVDRNFNYEFYEDGQIIFLQHEMTDTVYIIVEGQVCIKKINPDKNKETYITVFKKDDIFGEMSLIESKPRSATAIAIGNSTLLAISRDKIDLLFSQPNFKTVVSRLITLFSERTWRSALRVWDKVLPDPLERIYNALCTEALFHKFSTQETCTFSFGIIDLFQNVGLDIATIKNHPFWDKISDGESFSVVDLLEGFGFYDTKNSTAPNKDHSIFYISNKMLTCTSINTLGLTKDGLLDKYLNIVIPYNSLEEDILKPDLSLPLSAALYNVVTSFSSKGLQGSGKNIDASV